MGQIWSTCTPTTLPDKIFKHWIPLDMKSSGNSKNIGLHYPFGSNVGRHPQNAKFSNVLLRRHISEVRVNFVICISLGLLQRVQCSHCKRCISYGNSVRPSVCPSHAGIVSKRRHVVSRATYFRPDAEQPWHLSFCRLESMGISDRAT